MKRTNFPDGMIGNQETSGRLVGESDEMADEAVDVTLVAGAIKKTVVLEGVEEFADDFVQELGAVAEVEMDILVAGIEQDVVEASEAHVGLVIGELVGVGAAAEGLADGVANSEAANSVGATFVEPDFDQAVEGGLFADFGVAGLAVAENSLVGVEVGLADFDGSIAVKGLAHAKTSFVRFAAFGGLFGDSGSSKTAGG